MSEVIVESVSAPPAPAVENRVQPVARPYYCRGFWSLVVAQFQGALNETGLKNLVIFIILGMAMQRADRDRLVLVVGTLFALPFILFSMTGGFLADKYSKRRVAIWTKYFEIAVMLLAIAGLSWQNLKLEMAAVFLASTQAALFGPTKYGLLPELLQQSQLSWGNGVLEFASFLAVIGGGVSGAILADVFQGRQGWSGLIFVGLSLVGLLLTLGITKDPAKSFRANPVSDLWSKVRLICVTAEVRIRR